MEPSGGLPLTTPEADLKDRFLALARDLQQVLDHHRHAVQEQHFTNAVKARALEQAKQELAGKELHVSSSDEDLLTSICKLAINFELWQSSPLQVPTLSTALRADATQEKIYLPTLKFTVKDDKATLDSIKPTVRYGLKVVRILHQSLTDRNNKTLRCIDFPGKDEQLARGDECWVVPLLETDVEISDRDDCQKNIDDAFRHLYEAWPTATPDLHNERTTLGRCTAGKLRYFAEAFSTDGKLVLDWLPLRLETYDADAPAAICTDKVAEKLLEHVNGLEKEELEGCPTFTARRPEYLHWFQAAAASGEELKVQLRYMNMRNKYNISPVGVIHGGSGLQGIWEIPERWTTVVNKGDRILFLEPAEKLREAFESKVDSLMRADLPYVEKRIKFSGQTVSHRADLKSLLEALKQCKDKVLDEVQGLKPSPPRSAERGRRMRKMQEESLMEPGQAEEAG